MALQTSVLINPHTCAVRRIETGLFVGKKRGQGTFQEWPSDARYHRLDRRSSHVTRFDEIAAAEKALQVREDELLSEGYVRVDENADLAKLLAHHDPWKTWLRAKDSPAPLTELWKGLAPQAALERPKVAVASVGPDAIVLATRAGKLTCELPLDPEELGEAPAFLLPFLVRHFCLSGAVDFFWDAYDEGTVLTAGELTLEFESERGTLVATDAENGTSRVVPPTAATLIEAVLAHLS